MTDGREFYVFGQWMSITQSYATKDVESLWLMEKGPILVCFFSSDMMWHYVKFICGSYKLVQDKGQVKYKHLRIVLTWVNVLAPAEETLRKSGRRECGRWKMNCKIYRSQIDDILNIWGWISHFWLSAMYCFRLVGWNTAHVTHSGHKTNAKNYLQLSYLVWCVLGPVRIWY